MSNINTGKMLKLIETDNINKVPFEAGQYIIVDGGFIYYDPTTGTTDADRICINPKHEVDIYERIDNNNDAYYLSLHTRPISGDLVIIKDLIPNSTKYSYTIYVYNNNEEDTNENEWCKLTGSYNAKDIYLNKDIEITVPFEQLLNEPKTINASGKNIEEVLNNIFSPELYPKVVQPSVDLSFPEAGCYEVGSIVTPTYSVELNLGSYEFGPDTDVIPNTYIIVASDDTTKNSQTGTFSPIAIDESTRFAVSASILYSDGAVPLTNKGNEYIEGQIKAGSASAQSKNISGYRNGLFYGCLENYVDEWTVNSDIIRSLNKTEKSYTAENIDLKIPVGTKSIILACPTNNIGVTKIYNHTVNCHMIQAFGNPSEVFVFGNNESNKYGAMYNVWIYNPAEAYTIETDLTITLS